jgi:hypothetical protein
LDHECEHFLPLDEYGWTLETPLDNDGPGTVLVDLFFREKTLGAVELYLQHVCVLQEKEIKQGGGDHHNDVLHYEGLSSRYTHGREICNRVHAFQALNPDSDLAS